jgi:hypothetical protein
MKRSVMLRVTWLVTSLGVFATAVSHPSLAQNALGGPAKPKQSAIGGAPKPAPAIGGTASSASTITKPPAMGGVTKPTSAGLAATGNSIGNPTTPRPTVGGTVKQSLPITQPNKGGTVVTSNLKCGGGACVARGKP